MRRICAAIKHLMMESRCGETYFVCTSKGTQNQYILIIRGTYYHAGLVYVHEVYTGTVRGIITIQEYVLTQVLTLRVGLCT